jgi:hypothetical protein
LRTNPHKFGGFVNAHHLANHTQRRKTQQLLSKLC